PVMKYLADAVLLHEPARKRYCRDAPVVEPDHVRTIADRVHHAGAFVGRDGQWFLAKDDLPRSSGRYGDLRMQGIRHGNVDDIDILAPHHGAPVRLDALPSPGCGDLLQIRAIAAADRGQAQLRWNIEEMFHLPKGIGVSPAHEALADRCDTDNSFRQCDIA